MASSEFDLAAAEAQVERSLAFLDSVSQAEAAAQERADAMRAKYTDLWASGVDAVREYHRNLEQSALREAQLHDLSAVLSRLQARERADEERATEMSLADVHAGFGPMAGVLPATALLGAMLGGASLFDTPSRAGIAAPSARTPDDPMPLRFHPRAAAAPAPAQAYPSPADTIMGRYGISAVLSPGQRVSVPTAAMAAQPVPAPAYGAPAIDAAAPVLGRPAVLSPGTLAAAEQADLETALALSLSECEGADSAGGSTAAASATSDGGSTSARAGRSADAAANHGTDRSGHAAPRTQRAAAQPTGAGSSAASSASSVSASASRAYGFRGRMAPTVASRPAAAGGVTRAEATAHSVRSSGSGSGPPSSLSRSVPVGGATTATLPAGSHRHSGSSGSNASTGSGRGPVSMGPRSAGVDRGLGTAEAPFVIDERDDTSRAGYPAGGAAEGRSAGPAALDEEAEFQRQLAEAMRLSEAEAEAASAAPMPLAGGGGSTATQSSSRSRVTAPSGATSSAPRPAGGLASGRAATSDAGAGSLGGAAAFRGADPVTAGLARSAYAALAAADETTRMRAPAAGQRAPIATSSGAGAGARPSGTGLSAPSAGTGARPSGTGPSAPSAGTVTDDYLPARGGGGPVRSVRAGGPAAVGSGLAGGASRSGISTSMRGSGAPPGAGAGTAAPGAGSRAGASGGNDYGAAARRI